MAADTYSEKLFRIRSMQMGWEATSGTCDVSNSQGLSDWPENKGCYSVQLKGHAEMTGVQSNSYNS